MIVKCQIDLLIESSMSPRHWERVEARKRLADVRTVREEQVVRVAERPSGWELWYEQIMAGVVA